jgi:hypothetical protein
MNTKKLLEIVQKIPEARALYSYSITQDTHLPVVVVSASTASSLEPFKQLDIESIIMITTDDLTHGHDVY